MSQLELNKLEHWYIEQEESIQACLLAARAFILKISPHFTEHFKYGGPFFYYKKKMLCYFWIEKKRKLPYISFADGKQINHPALEDKDMKRFRVLFLNPKEDLPVKDILAIIEASINLRES